MSQNSEPSAEERLSRLVECLDSQAGRFKSLRGATSYGEYVEAKGDRADEEVLTEPVLGGIIEKVLGFPGDAYFPQLGKGGLKPDFTPIDLVAHPFVFDAKASDQNLRAHEPQIRRYITQRSLDYGILFNLREFRVYRREAPGYDETVSFPLFPLWQVARGEAIAGPELKAFESFCEHFSYRRLGLKEKIAYIRAQRPWPVRLAEREPVEVDIEFLVEQLHRLSGLLAEDASAQRNELSVALDLNPGRKRRLLDELKLLALDIEPGADVQGLPTDLEAWRTTEGLAARVWRQYLLRVAYLALTRILLYRAWEDVQFVGDFLHDGGFDAAYERLSKSVRKILNEAFLHGAERYRWLFGADNNYDWYRPREAALVEVLYSLAPVPLGKLDADVLGALYVSYVDEIDRDRLGQFFTPRPVVRFMLDRAGFSGGDVFKIEGDRRVPRRLFDFATGSGGFLVEAARRVIDDGGVSDEDPRELNEALASIVRGFVGGEISPFPYYLTEVNLLLQVSRLLGKLRIVGADPPAFVLGVLHVDSLTSKTDPEASIDRLDAELRADRGELVADEAFDLVPLDPEKLERFRELREPASFDLVVGNPPYVTETGNRPLFERLRAIPAWKGIYRGKTDYSYYFLYLAAEKLAPGGRLCVITPAGWMNAGAADFLRKKLATELRLDQLYLFGNYRLFADEQGPAPTPLVESAILVATKLTPPADHALRVVVLEDEAAAGHPDRQSLLDEMASRVKGKPGRSQGIHVHDIKQGELQATAPWPVKFAATDVPRRVVAHLEQAAEDDSSPVEPLVESWKVLRGVETGADAYSRRIERRLSSEARRSLQAEGKTLGDPIYELPPGAEKASPWRDHPEVLCRSPEPTAILYGAIDEEDYTNLIRLTRGAPPSDDVLEVLRPWRPLLASRAGFADFPNRPWWETHRARDLDDLRAPKVIALYRTDRGRFALDEEGVWEPSNKSTLVVSRKGDSPAAYLCGLLNSELLDLWYAVRGKHPRDIWRNYEPKRMNEMPYRRPEGDERAEQIAKLVRCISGNRLALLSHRPYFRRLGSVVKDPWRTEPVEIDRPSLVGGLQQGEIVSIRLDPQLRLEITKRPLGRAFREEREKLVFRRARSDTAIIEGPPGRLDLLEEILGSASVDDVSAVVLPKDLAKFEQMIEGRKREVEHLLAEGRRLVEEVERLVCSLYGLPDDLTDEVIAHAVARLEAVASPA